MATEFLPLLLSSFSTRGALARKPPPGTRVLALNGPDTYEAWRRSSTRSHADPGRDEYGTYEPPTQATTKLMHNRRQGPHTSPGLSRHRFFSLHFAYRFFSKMFAPPICFSIHGDTKQNGADSKKGANESCKSKFSKGEDRRPNLAPGSADTLE